MIPVLLALGLAGFVMFKAFQKEHRNEALPARAEKPEKRYHVRFTYTEPGTGDNLDNEFFATDVLKEAEAAYQQLHTEFTEKGFHNEEIYILDSSIPKTIKSEVL